jgi:hypothetical protein
MVWYLIKRRDSFILPYLSSFLEDKVRLWEHRAVFVLPF